MSVIIPTKNGSVPAWPGLYNPGIDWLPIDGENPVQEEGAYLYANDDIFRFFLYWTLVFYIPVFTACGIYAFINLTFRPKRSYSHPHLHDMDINPNDNHHWYPLSPVMPQSPKTPTSATHQTETSLLRGPSPAALKAPLRENELRSRITFAFLVFLSFIALGMAGTFISSAIVGFVTASVFQAAGYYVSTWVPFLFSLMHVLVGFLSIYPSVVDII